MERVEARRVPYGTRFWMTESGEFTDTFKWVGLGWRVNHVTGLRERSIMYESEAGVVAHVGMFQGLWVERCGHAECSRFAVRSVVESWRDLRTGEVFSRTVNGCVLHPPRRSVTSLIVVVEGRECELLDLVEEGSLRGGFACRHPGCARVPAGVLIRTVKRKGFFMLVISREEFERWKSLGIVMRMIEIIGDESELYEDETIKNSIYQHPMWKMLESGYMHIDNMGLGVIAYWPGFMVESK